MSNSNADTTIDVSSFYPSNMQAALDQIVSGRGNVTPITAREGDPESITFNSATDEVRVSGTVRPGSFDLSRNYKADVNQLIDSRNSKVEQLNKVTGFDAAGKPVYAVTGHARDVLTRELQGLDQSLEYQMQVYHAAEAHRATVRAAEEQAQREEVARTAFAGNDKARQAAFDAAKLAEEARLAARAVLASRK